MVVAPSVFTVMTRLLINIHEIGSPCSRCYRDVVSAKCDSVQTSKHGFILDNAHAEFLGESTSTNFSSSGTKFHVKRRDLQE